MLKICMSYNQIIYEYVTVTVTACLLSHGYMIRDRFASSEHQRAYVEDIHEQVWICTEGDGYIIWGKGLHGENVFPGGDVYNL
jgi:hypothetical protein